jgi:hypothetical protein
MTRKLTFDEELLTHGSAACARLGDEPPEVTAPCGRR